MSVDTSVQRAQPQESPVEDAAPRTEPSAPAAPRAPGPLRDDGPGVLSWIVPAYLALIVVGAAVFKFGPVMARGHEMSAARAVFTAVNAATLTGFPSTVGLEDLDEEGTLGPVTVLVLMVGGGLFSMIGGGVSVVRVLGLPYSQRQVVSAALAALVLAVLAGATPLLAPDRRVFDSVFQAAGAFTNSGLYVGRLSPPATLRAQAVLLPLAVLGGLGLPVLMELFDRFTGGIARLSVHTKTVLGMSALLYVLATVVFGVMLVPWSPDALPAGAQVKPAVASASALAVNGRGLGLPFEFASSYPRALQWLLIVLMAVGANPAGTGGGVKATTVAELVAGVRAALRGRRVTRTFGVAAVWLAVYLAIVFGGLLLLLWRVPDLSGERLLFLTVSAASNVGLAHDPVSITGPGLYTLCAVMLAGRVAPVFLLGWMARTTADADVAVA